MNIIVWNLEKQENKLLQWMIHIWGEFFMILLKWQEGGFEPLSLDIFKNIKRFWLSY